MPKHPDCKLYCELFFSNGKEGENCLTCLKKGIECLGGEHPIKDEVMTSISDDSDANQTYGHVKKRRIPVYTSPDENTEKYLSSLPEILPETYDDLLNYLNIGNSPNHPFYSKKDYYNIEHWDEFANNCCIMTEPNKDCELLSLAFSNFGLQPSTATDNSEIYLTPLVDSAFQSFALLIKRLRDRNVTTDSSGETRPDYCLESVFYGEEMLYINYIPEVLKHDPYLELEQKCPWDRWAEFYGDCPYVLAFGCIGSNSNVDVTVGILELKSRKFKPLFTKNLVLASDRPKFAREILKLFPVLKAISIKTKSVKSRIGQVWTRNNGKTVKLGVRSNEAVVKISWQRGDINSARQWHFQQDNIFSIINEIFEKLSSDDKRAFPIMRKHSLTISPIDPCYVIGEFYPYGATVCIETESEFLGAVISIAKAVKILHGVNIIHNDIRWGNIVETSNCNPKSYCIIDFDDAFLVQNGSLCSKIERLDRIHHSQKTFLDHSFEVDVWSVGHLLTSFPNSQFSSRFYQLNCEICNNYESLSLDDVLQMLENEHKKLW